MKTNIELKCDRCGHTIHGMVIEADEKTPRTTAGFYDVSEGSCWNEFSHDRSEQNVCDFCMWDDEQFQAQYPTP